MRLYQPSLVLSVILFAFLACNKEPAEKELESGKGRIIFNVSSPVIGSSKFDVGNTKWTGARAEVLSGITTAYSVSAATGPTATDTYSSVWIKLPLGFDLSTGNPHRDFSKPLTDTSVAVFSFKKDFGSINYTSKSGTLTITKLSNEEIEGTFQCVVRSYNDPNDTLVVSNGTFHGKF